MKNENKRTLERKLAVLVVEDTYTELSRYLRNLREFNFEAYGATSLEAAQAIIRNQHLDLVITDLHLGNAERIEGLELIDSVRDENPKLPMIAMSFDLRVSLADEVRKRGVNHFIRKPIASAEELTIHVTSALDQKLVSPESPWSHYNNANEEIKRRYPDGVVVSEENLKFIEIAAKNPELAVCIYGETGTGKEEIAKLIHRRRDHSGSVPFISLNCANLNGDLMFSTLFGHKKGSFTGSVENTVGAIGQADGGILFLDEIHRLSPNAQERLLRVINDGSYQRLGDTKEMKSNFQIVIASTHNLDEEVEAGHFLIDLRMRLIGLEIHLLPLRERKPDIADLIQLCFAKQDKTVAISPMELAKLVQKCSNFYWQGNIRQLFKVLQTYIIISSMNVEELQAETLPIFKTMFAPGEVIKDIGNNVLFNNAFSLIKSCLSEDVSVDAIVEAAEKLAMYHAMQRHPTIVDACRGLAMPRSTFDTKRKKYGL